MSIRIKLLASIVLLAVVIAIVSAFAFFALNKESQLANTIVADRVIPMEQLKIIADRYAVNIVDTTHKVRAGSISFDDGKAAVESALNDVSEQWKAYRATYLTDEETGLADKFELQRKSADAGVSKLLSILSAKDKSALVLFAEKELYPTIDPLGTDIANLIDLQIRVAKENLAEGNAVKDGITYVMVGLSVLAGFISILATWTVLAGVIRPVNSITKAMGNLAAGDLDVTVFGEGRTDEIGMMASAVTVFRENARERQKLEAQAAENRALAERERLERERLQQIEAAEVRHAVDSIGEALGALADGRLNHRIKDSFAPRLDKVRVDFNEAVAKLEHALRSVGENAHVIAAGASQIFSAAEDLSRRTERQAASVEETAAALEQITTTVNDSATRAQEAGKLVLQTRTYAEKSGDIVSRAMQAMQEIESSSSEISKIIGVIDEIAFQTNLLALNAGVEAARAGETGKGFAVVAQEVRELAQRSAGAAKEIKDLIVKSGDQVKNGVGLVTDAGKALSEIVSQIQAVSSNVSAIVEGTKEQAIGMREINTAINIMDQGTQQNAAMVEESTAASQSLAKESEDLFNLMKQFQVGSPAETANVRSAKSAA